MPDETLSAASGNGARFSGVSVNASSSLDQSDVADERATRLAELQEQVGAEQVGVYADLKTHCLNIKLRP